MFLPNAVQTVDFIYLILVTQWCSTTIRQQPKPLLVDKMNYSKKILVRQEFIKKISDIFQGFFFHQSKSFPYNVVELHKGIRRGRHPLYLLISAGFRKSHRPIDVKIIGKNSHPILSVRHGKTEL